MKTKNIEFGPVEALGSTGRLILLGSIDACQPRRRKARSGFIGTLFWMSLITMLGAAGWLVLDGIRRGVILTGFY